MQMQSNMGRLSFARKSVVCSVDVSLALHTWQRSLEHLSLGVAPLTVRQQHCSRAPASFADQPLTRGNRGLAGPLRLRPVL